MTANTASIKWNGSTLQARQLQEKLRSGIDLSPLKKKCRFIGGSDISFNKKENAVYAAIVVLRIDDDGAINEIVEEAVGIDQVNFPYIPGFLSFREVPPLLKLWNTLKIKPDVLMLDGHGIMHPRSMGVATHFGLETGIPTLGCAKKRLVGEYLEPGLERGSASPLFHQGELRGYVYRSRALVKPIFVSPGTGMSIDDALDFVRLTGGRYRLPEPTRLAHQAANRLRRQYLDLKFNCKSGTLLE